MAKISMDCGLRWFVCFFCLCGCEEDLTSTWFKYILAGRSSKIRKPFGSERYENLLDTKRYENLLDPRSRSKIRKPFGSKSYGGKLFEFWREKISIRKTDGQGPTLGC